MDNTQELKRMAVNAMTGHMPCTPDSLYELGKALESVCEEVERVESFEEKANDADETIQEQANTIDDLKCMAKEYALKVETV